MLALLMVLLPSLSWGATYYVSTVGNDANDGSSESPWRNPQKCALSPIAAGDTCIVRSGTYTDHDANGNVVQISSSLSSPIGTASAPITIRSEVPYGAIIQVPGTMNGGNNGFFVSRPYYIIEWFDIDGTGGSNNTGTNAAHHGLSVYASNTTIRNNKIHHIARTLCSTSVFGMDGIFLNAGTADQLIEDNTLYTIGRLRGDTGESGCTLTAGSGGLSHHDHGIYSAGVTNLTIRRNVFYDINRGYAVQFYLSGGATHVNVKMSHNTFAGKAPTSWPISQVLLTGTITGCDINNNVFYQPHTAPFRGSGALTVTGCTISHNSTDINEASGPDDFFTGTVPAGVTLSNNTESASLGFVNALCTQSDGGCQNTDFHLLSTSALINAGADLGAAFCGSAPDRGRYEVCAPQSAAIDTVNVDLAMDGIYLPYSPQSGATGWSVSCSPSCGTLTVANVTALSNSVLRVQISGFTGGFCLNTQTITVSYSSATGSLLDSVGQPVYSFSSFPVTNNCSGSGPPTLPGSPYIIYELDGNVNDSSGGARHGTQSGGAFVAAKHGQGLQGTLGSAVSVTAPYGSGINPSTQSLTIAVGYFVPAGETGSDITVFGSSLGTNQRFYIQAKGGTWQVGIQATAVSAATPSDLSVTEGWNHLCLRVDSGADVATLYKNGVAATMGRGLQSYTSYTLASNLGFGLPSGFTASGGGGGIWDRAVLYTSLESCSAIYDNWEPPPPSSSAGYAQVSYRWERVYQHGGLPIPIGTINTPIEVVEAGAVALVVQVDRTGSNGAALSIVPRYCHNAVALPIQYPLVACTGGFNHVIPVTIGADGIGLWGGTVEVGLNAGVADCCVSGSLVEHDGNTILAAPVERIIVLNQDHSTVYRYIIRVGPAGHLYEIRLYNANGTPLTAYPQTPTLVSIPQQALIGF